MSQDKTVEIKKKINLMGRGLILAWNTWNKDTAEHAQARDKAIDDFTADIYSLVADCEGCRDRDKEIEQLKQGICGLCPEKDEKITSLQQQLTEAQGKRGKVNVYNCESHIPDSSVYGKSGKVVSVEALMEVLGLTILRDEQHLCSFGISTRDLEKLATAIHKAVYGEGENDK